MVFGKFKSDSIPLLKSPSVAPTVLRMNTQLLDRHKVSCPGYLCGFISCHLHFFCFFYYNHPALLSSGTLRTLYPSPRMLQLSLPLPILPMPRGSCFRSSPRALPWILSFPEGVTFLSHVLHTSIVQHPVLLRNCVYERQTDRHREIICITSVSALRRKLQESREDDRFV